MSNAAADDATKLWEMISGYMISQVVSVTATLGLADLLAKGAMSGEALGYLLLERKGSCGFRFVRGFVQW